MRIWWLAAAFFSEAMRSKLILMGASFTALVMLLSFLIAPLSLGTVDKIISRIPVAGWLLAGEDKALLSAHFSVKGELPDQVKVQPMPLDTLSGPTIGLLRRTLGLPFKLIDSPQILIGGDSGRELPGNKED